MKKIFATMVMIVAIATSAAAMNRHEIRNTARVMTDRMAIDLRRDRYQEARVFEINLRYVSAIDNPRADMRRCIDIRNHELRRVLSGRQFDRYMASSHSRWTPRHHGPGPHHGPGHPGPRHHRYDAAPPRHHRY